VINIQILESGDIITSDCYVRQLTFLYDSPHSDSLFFDNTYGGGPINRLTWSPVQRCMSAWIGSTVKDYEDFCNSGIKKIFCKGDLPKKMITPLTFSQFISDYYVEYLKSLQFNWVKKHPLRGKNCHEIRQLDESYFNWMVSEGSVLKEDALYQNYLDVWYSSCGYGKLPQESHEFAWMLHLN